MKITDPIADMLIRIKNAARAKKSEVILPYSKVKVAILEILKKRNFISDFSKSSGEKPSHQNLSIQLNPEKSDIEVRRISKPGRRMYFKSTDIKKIHGGLGIAIISTPKGITSGEEAKKMNIGGELICEVF